MKVNWWLVASFCLLLSACGPREVPVVDTQRVTIEVPASLQQECFIPKPHARGAPQSAVADYVLELNKALEDCAARHGQLVGTINKFRDSIDNLNAQ